MPSHTLMCRHITAHAVTYPRRHLPSLTNRHTQRHLVKHADNSLVPKVDNTNVDRSVATIHTTVLRCLARTGTGQSLYDPVRKQVSGMPQFFDAHHETAWSSKAMLQVLIACAITHSCNHDLRS